MKAKLVEKDPLVANMNFDRIGWKLVNGSNNTLTKDEVRKSIEQYKKFLELKRKYPNLELVPTEEIDSVWHAHILDTKNYAKDCELLFGKFLHHAPYFGPYGHESQDDMKDWFKETSNVWKKEYGEVLEEPLRFRCRDKKCHAPSNCRCR